ARFLRPPAPPPEADDVPRTPSRPVRRALRSARAPGAPRRDAAARPHRVQPAGVGVSVRAGSALLAARPARIAPANAPVFGGPGGAAGARAVRDHRGQLSVPAPDPRRS